MQLTDWKTKKLYAASQCVSCEFTKFNFDKDGVFKTCEKCDFGPAINDPLSKCFKEGGWGCQFQGLSSDWSSAERHM